MRTLFAITFAVCAGLSAVAQGTLVYDQQSSADETSSFSPVHIQFYGSVGQSFTPSLSRVDFVRLRLRDAAPGNSLGATLVVNVRSDSMSGPILGASTPIAFADNYNVAANFLFGSIVPVVSNTTYFLDVVVQTGDDWGLVTLGDTYPSGSFYGSGFPFSGADLWFREGILVPEPSSVLVLFMGGGVVGWFMRQKMRHRMAAGRPAAGHVADEHCHRAP